MVRVMITSKKVMPRTANFHSFIKTKNSLAVLHLKMERVTIVLQNLTLNKIWLNGLVAINFAKMILNVSFMSLLLDCSILFIFYKNLILNNS